MTHPALAWLVSHAAWTINRRQVGEDGKTNYERLKGKRFKRQEYEFGQCGWYLKPGTRGQNEWLSRWGKGVYLGYREKSNEIYVGAPQGVIKVRDFRKRGIMEDRWNWQEFSMMQGVQWEPIPGRLGVQAKSSASRDNEDPCLRHACSSAMRAVQTPCC